MTEDVSAWSPEAQEVREQQRLEALYNIDSEEQHKEALDLFVAEFGLTPDMLAGLVSKNDRHITVTDRGESGYMYQVPKTVRGEDGRPLYKAGKVLTVPDAGWQLVAAMVRKLENDPRTPATQDMYVEMGVFFKKDESGRDIFKTIPLKAAEIVTSSDITSEDDNNSVEAAKRVVRRRGLAEPTTIQTVEERQAEIAEQQKEREQIEKQLGDEALEAADVELDSASDGSGENLSIDEPRQPFTVIEGKGIKHPAANGSEPIKATLERLGLKGEEPPEVSNHRGAVELTPVASEAATFERDRKLDIILGEARDGAMRSLGSLESRVGDIKEGFSSLVDLPKNVETLTRLKIGLENNTYDIERARRVLSEVADKLHGYARSTAELSQNGYADALLSLRGIIETLHSAGAGIEQNQSTYEEVVGDALETIDRRDSKENETVTVFTGISEDIRTQYQGLKLQLVGQQDSVDMLHVEFRKQLANIEKVIQSTYSGTIDTNGIEATIASLASMQDRLRQISTSDIDGFVQTTRQKLAILT